MTIWSPYNSTYPRNPVINPESVFAQGHEFGWLGHTPTTGQLWDASRFRRHGLPAGFSGAGDTLVDRFVQAAHSGIGRPALGFDGVNDYVACPSPSIIGWGAITVEMWALARTWDATAAQDAYDGTGLAAYLYGGKTSHLCTAGVFTTAGASSRTFAEPPVDTWFHWALTWQSGSGLVAWLNGVPTTAGTARTGTLASQGAISQMFGGSWNGWWPGSLAASCIWNRALAPAEIAVLADRYNYRWRYGGVDGIIDRTEPQILGRRRTEGWVTQRVMGIQSGGVL